MEYSTSIDNLPSQQGGNQQQTMNSGPPQNITYNPNVPGVSAPQNDLIPQQQQNNQGQQNVNMQVQHIPSQNQYQHTQSMNQGPSHQNNAIQVEQRSVYNHPPQSTVQNSLVNDFNDPRVIEGSRLPSRDIPMDTSRIARDHTARPDYVPDEGPRGYIENKQDNINIEEQLQAFIDKQEAQRQSDSLYENAKTPLLVAVLFLVFQSSYLNKLLRKSMPAGFLDSDGHVSVQGQLIKALLFGSGFYFVMTGIEWLNSV